MLLMDAGCQDRPLLVRWSVEGRGGMRGPRCNSDCRDWTGSRLAADWQQTGGACRYSACLKFGPRGGEDSGIRTKDLSKMWDQQGHARRAATPPPRQTPPDPLPSNQPFHCGAPDDDDYTPLPPAPSNRPTRWSRSIANDLAAGDLVVAARQSCID
ncbi:uncharacterized protein UV8b_06870 [Ustilaginoidea virens]|uniref:Uncharacterized protein n=1 Tax=Ustilaginoidea virens TaxID=1159556 RepID=A0A8E5HW09_USTVR|nr:uncharacterized protein UV8b_06870 [Ustilaginoidea virens]QUC22629.1 hypothetical protein UV8b_06870 [Ustilaginoidea virens]